MNGDITEIYPERRKPVSRDPELQPHLARDAVTCLVELLTGQHTGAQVSAEPLGAVMMLIKQAGDTTCP